jgi:DNA replication protein DnaC
MESEGCAQCTQGFVSVTTYPSLYEGTVPIEKLYACACATGRRRLARTTGIERILSAEEMEEKYKDGIPQHDAHVLDILTKANVPIACHSWTIDTYQHRFQQMKELGEVVRRAQAWIDLPVRDRSDWVMLGPNGTGKTGLALALLRGVVDRGQSVQFWTVKHLSIVWRASYDSQLFERRDNTKREVELLEAITTPDLVVLDEFGGTSLSDFIESTVTMIVDTRQKALRPTILTLNLPETDMEDKKSIHKGMTTLLGPTLTDRLRERAQWLPLKGQSQRKAWKAAS